MPVIHRIANVLIAIALMVPSSTPVSAQVSLAPVRLCLSVHSANADGEFDMPLVSGKSAADAQAELCQKGLTVWVDPVWQCDSPRGQVTSQQPADGVKVKNGSYVIISVNQSGGSKVPNLAGKSYEDAEAMARQLGFRLDLTTKTKTDEGVSKTCGEQSVRWTGIETQSPAAGSNQCNSDPNWSISVSRTKLVQGKYSHSICHPREYPCGRRGQLC